MIIIAVTHDDDSRNDDERIIFINGTSSDDVFDKYDELKFNKINKKR